MSFVLKFCFILLGLVCSFKHTESKLLEINLVRHKSVFHELCEAATTHSDLLKTLHLLYQDSTNMSIPLFKYLDSEFYGELQIGKPVQKFNVMFDTAWSDSWIPSSKCSKSVHFCNFHSKYNSARSVTYRPVGTAVSIPLSGGTFEGFVSQDLFHVGQVNITNQTFIEMTNIPTLLDFTRADGLIGLPFTAVSKFTQPFLFKLINSQQIQPEFSVYINRHVTTSKGGSIVIGGVDPKHCRGNFTTVPVLGSQGVIWDIALNHILIDTGRKNFTVCQKGCTGFFDTSTSSITGPQEEIYIINSAIGARKFILGKYVVPCDKIKTLPKLMFNINGQYYSINGPNYVQKMNFGGFSICVSAFADGSSLWQIGVSFMSSYYMKFDLKNRAVGIVPLR